MLDVSRNGPWTRIALVLLWFAFARRRPMSSAALITPFAARNIYPAAISDRPTFVVSILRSGRCQRPRPCRLQGSKRFCLWISGVSAWRQVRKAMDVREKYGPELRWLAGHPSIDVDLVMMYDQLVSARGSGELDQGSGAAHRSRRRHPVDRPMSPSTARRRLTRRS